MQLLCQVAESAISALVQTNFLISALGGISQIQELSLKDTDLQGMAFSILVSCLSLGLGFATRDKLDAKVLGLPGKVDWGLTMLGLVMARSLEVTSRVLAFNIIQVSVRGWPLLRFGGVFAAMLALLLCKLSFPDAPAADVVATWPHAPGSCRTRAGNSIPGFQAAVIAHPGQVLEPNSLLPLKSAPQLASQELSSLRCLIRRSLALHVLLAAAASGSQLLLRSSKFNFPSACKAAVALTHASVYGAWSRQPLSAACRCCPTC